MSSIERTMSVMSSNSGGALLHLLNLPTEIRVNIYERLLEDEPPALLSSGRLIVHSGLLLTNKQIAQELHDVLQDPATISADVLDFDCSHVLRYAASLSNEKLQQSRRKTLVLNLSVTALDDAFAFDNHATELVEDVQWEPLLAWIRLRADSEGNDHNIQHFDIEYRAVEREGAVPARMLQEALVNIPHYDWKLVFNSPEEVKEVEAIRSAFQHADPHNFAD